MTELAQLLTVLPSVMSVRGVPSVTATMLVFIILFRYDIYVYINSSHYHYIVAFDLRNRAICKIAFLIFDRIVIKDILLSRL